MPISKSAIKNLRKTKKNTIRNKRFMDRVKGYIKELQGMVTKGDTSTATTTLPKVISYVDRAAKKNLLHHNKAARIKSKLAKAVK